MVLLRNNHRFSGGLCSEIARRQPDSVWGFIGYIKASATEVPAEVADTSFKGGGGAMNIATDQGAYYTFVQFLH